MAIPRPKAVAAILLSSAMAAALSACFAQGTAPSASSTDSRIKVAMLQPPRSGLTPLSDDAFKLSRWKTAETLVVLDALGDAQPSLSTAWTQLDGRNWRFELRAGVKFHDGTLLTAEQVAASLTAAANAKPKPRILDGVQLSVRTDGGNAVVVTTQTDDPLVPQRLSSPQLSILAASAYKPGGVVSPINAGTGPYVLASADGTSSATLNRFADYWGEKAASSGVDVQYVPDGTARAAALRTGTADVVEAIPVGQVAQIKADLIHEVPMPRTNTLYLNTKAGPFADPSVRAAARTSVERTSIVDRVYEGRADIAEGLLGPALPWAAKERQNTSYIEALKKRADAAPANGRRIKLGTFTDRAELPEVAVQLEQQLEAAGFIVEQEVREYQHIEADALAGKFDAFILSRATVLDSGDPVAYMFSDFSCKGSFNISQFCDPEVDAALSKAAAIPAGPERRAAIAAAEALILSKDAAVPLLHERIIQGESARIRNVERDPRERALITSKTGISG
ncbi:ABC transporter substrate-binding protein [Arthrobacter sp. efr-133-TYG-120]|uniref:ABC transporter substrate-binding protein n=1 Tax=Arthrobacter sp. efr-133-TYG-120 TaxID=3040280 RepID=UPI00254DCA21|nr:ABC transporter substrate-binding protein [Arthrobacter sp. efr-133-TYG-120]